VKRQRCFLVLLLLFVAALSGCSGERGTMMENQASPAVAQKKETVRFLVAGSGTNLPITAKLTAAYKNKTGRDIEAAKSIGTDGAVKAVLSGDLKLGLISRPLTEEETKSGLKAVSYARVGIVFAVHPSVTETEISTEDVLRIMKGEKKTWADGTRILVLIRGLHDSSNQVFSEQIPGFSETVSESIAEKRWQVMYHDSDIADMLRQKTGSFGYTDTSEITIGGIKGLGIDGVSPSVKNIENGTYPFFKDLEFAYRGELSEQAQAFIAFVKSAEGRAIIENGGGAALK